MHRFVFYVLLLGVILFPLFSMAQSHTEASKRIQAIYVEGLGAAFTYAFTYDTRFTPKPEGWGVKIGVGPYVYKDDYYISLPLQVYYLFGSYRHFFEVGGGVTGVLSDIEPNYYYDYSMGAHLLVYDTNYNIFNPGKNKTLVATLAFGYRFQPARGLIFRGTLTPFFGLFGQENFGGRKPYLIPYMAGVSLGYSF